jgi:cobalamin biosynthesis Mg chelatase CobN
MMANENTSGQKPASGTPKAANTTNATNPTQRQSQAKPATAAKKGGAKGNKSRVGGTALPGAKSTLPKQIPTGNNPAQQQAESYNRDMRRRMQHLGTGPQSDQRANTLQEQRRKRIERRKQRVEAERARLRRSTPGGRITLGRRNLYFILGVVALVVLLIVIFVVLRTTHVIH